MTVEEVIENELKCVQRDCCRLENECAKCDLVLPKEEIINAYNKALRLEKENANLKALRKYELNVSKLEIEKLEKENAELNDKLNNLSKVAEVRLANWQKYEQENAELKAKLKPENCLKLLAKEGYIKFSSEQLTKAKKLLEDLIKFQPYINREAFFISLGNEWKTAIYKAEQFLKENNNEQART